MRRVGPCHWSILLNGQRRWELLSLSFGYRPLFLSWVEGELRHPCLRILWIWNYDTMALVEDNLSNMADSYTILAVQLVFGVKDDSVVT